MSPEMGADHSHDDAESAGSMKEKELEPWLLSQVRNRLTPLSSLSRLTLTIPPIVTNIWRRLSSIGSRASSLSIIKPGSIASMIKPASLSSVWRRTLDLPLLRRTRAVQRMPRYRRASDTISEEPSVSDVELEPEESLLEEALLDESSLDEYSSIVPVIEEEQTTGATGEPDLSEHVREVHEVRGERLVNRASEIPPMAKENLLSRSVVEKGKPTTTDSSSFPVPPSILAQQTEHVISRPGAIEANKQPQSTGSLGEIPASQQFSQIQGDDLKQSKDTRDTSLQSSEYTQPADESRQLEDTGSQLTEESGLKYIQHVPTQASEPAAPVDTSRRLDTGRSPISEIPKLATSLDRTTISAQNVPLIHPVSIPQQLYMKTSDEAVEPGGKSKAAQLPYVADALSGEDASSEAETPVRRTDVHYQPEVWAAEDSVPDSSLDKDLPHYLPVTEGTILGKSESVARPGLIQDSTQPLVNLPSGSLLNRDLNLEYLTARNIPRRQSEGGQTEKSVLRESPLLELLARKSVIGEDTVDLKSMSSRQGLLASNIQPASETISRAASKIEMPLRYPDTTVLYGGTPTSGSGSIQMSASAIPGYVPSTGISPVDEDDGSLLSRIRRLSAQSPGDTEQSSLERLSVSSYGSGESVYTTSGEAMAYSVSQPAQEIARTPAREPAEELTPEPALASVMRYSEVVSRQPVQAPGEGEQVAGEVTGESASETGSTDIYAMARDIYSILIRRIRRDRERMYGLC